MTSGHAETEIKLRVADAGIGHGLLLGAGFTISVPRIFERNAVYDFPGAILRNRGELLRLRLAGERAVLTWKGPEIPGKYKSRSETEVNVSDYETCARLLKNLGYELAFFYEKYRTEYLQPDEPGSATVDETPVGTFLELEGEAGWIDSTAATLGFKESSYVTMSYRELYLSFCEEHHIEASGMRFAD